ncbi:putative membrane protein [Raoultella ornithinolytica 2-156-04_S1_C2]|nr:putative membrane protein [Raoultella ornithinolytica 2-156-04_S1_C1]KDX16138.1 putative membrane protein [Raoultella ornithinolytica 2-156-04_S1_C2]
MKMLFHIPAVYFYTRIIIKIIIFINMQTELQLWQENQ